MGGFFWFLCLFFKKKNRVPNHKVYITYFLNYIFLLEIFTKVSLDFPLSLFSPLILTGMLVHMSLKKRKTKDTFTSEAKDLLSWFYSDREQILCYTTFFYCLLFGQVVIKVWCHARVQDQLFLGHVGYLTLASYGGFFKICLSWMSEIFVISLYMQAFTFQF